MGALSPYRVLDLTGPLGAMCPKLLGDLGAEVIKIEPPGGDPARRSADGRPSREWLANNTSKHSLVCDIFSPEGAATFRTLVAGADFVTESFPPGVLAAAGLGFDELRAIRPDLVMTSITPFGQSGPRAHEDAGELELWAAAGVLYLTGDADRPPVAVSVPETNAHTSAEAAAATLIAHHGRLRTERAVHVDVSALEVLVDCITLTFPLYDFTGVSPRRKGWATIAPKTVHQLCYECADGHVTLGLIGGSSAWAGSSRKVVEWMTEEGAASEWLRAIDWQADYDASKLEQPTVDRAEAEVAAFLARQTKARIMTEFVNRRILGAPVRTVDDLVTSAQFQERGFWQSVEVEGKPVRVPGETVRLTATPMRVAPPPDLGSVSSLRPRPERRPTRFPARGDAALPLSGLKVLELAVVLAGPLVGRRLSTWGADVVRIESHLHPDTLRAGGFNDGRPGINRSALFSDVNAVKRSVALDVTAPGVAPVMAAAFEWADVVIAGSRPGVAESLGIGYEQARARRPDTIYFATSLHGYSGALSKVPGFGHQAGALAGISGVTGWPDRPPIEPNGAMTDYFSPRMGALAVMAAVDHRLRTGEGQFIDQSQIETAMLLLAPAVLALELDGVIAGRQGNRHHEAAPQGVFPVLGDDRWIAVSVFSDEAWRGLCSVAVDQPFAADAAFATAAGRKAEEDRLEDELARWTSCQDGPQLVARLQAAGVRAAVVADVGDVVHDAHLAARGSIRQLEHPEIGVFRSTGPSFALGGVTPLRHRGPLLGEQTDEFLGTDLGFSAAHIARLRRTGAITEAAEGEFRQAF